MSGVDTRILKILIDNGTDVNVAPDVQPYIRPFQGIWHYVYGNYEVAKIILSSPMLKLEDLTEYQVEYYNKIKAKMAFEEKVLADVEAVKAAHGGINSATIEPSFIPKKQVDAMMEYYSTGYKKKFSENIFDDLAGQVVELLNKYIKYGWH